MFYSLLRNFKCERNKQQLQRMKSTTNLDCLDPKPDDIGTARDRGKSIDITWFMPPSCYDHTGFVLTYTQGNTEHHASLDSDVTRHTLNGIKPDEPFQIFIVAIFEDGTRTTSDEYTFSTEPGIDSKNVAPIPFTYFMCHLASFCRLYVTVKIL